MTDRGHHELESDAHQLESRLRVAVDAHDWLAVDRLCERLQELAGRLYHHDQTAAGLARVRAINAPPAERECR